MVVTELPLDQAKGALEKLCFSAASPLEVCHLDYLHGCLIYRQTYNDGNCKSVNQEAAKEDLDKKHARELTVHIDRFAFLFRFV